MRPFIKSLMSPSIWRVMKLDVHGLKSQTKRNPDFLDALGRFGREETNSQLSERYLFWDPNSFQDRHFAPVIRPWSDGFLGLCSLFPVPLLTSLRNVRCLSQLLFSGWIQSEGCHLKRLILLSLNMKSRELWFRRLTKFRIHCRDFVNQNWKIVRDGSKWSHSNGPINRTPF